MQESTFERAVAIRKEIKQLQTTRDFLSKYIETSRQKDIEDDDQEGADNTEALHQERDGLEKIISKLNAEFEEL